MLLESFKLLLGSQIEIVFFSTDGDPSEEVLRLTKRLRLESVRMSNKPCHPNPTALVGDSLTDEQILVELFESALSRSDLVH